MRKRIFTSRFRPVLSTLLLATGLALTLAACGEDDDANDTETTGQSAIATAASTPTATGSEPTPTQDHDAMGHDSGTPMGSAEEKADPDLLFIDGMIEHHGSAIMMAEVALEQGEHEEIRQLAEEIITSQEAEIEQMRAWRDEWFPDAPESDMSGMMDMAGMDMSDADMEMLRDAEDFDLMFIDMMIPHHESAVEMAEALQEITERPELQQLTEEIITAQQAEIEQMREWREEWADQ